MSLSKHTDLTENGVFSPHHIILSGLSVLGLVFSDRYRKMPSLTDPYEICDSDGSNPIFESFRFSFEGNADLDWEDSDCCARCGRRIVAPWQKNGGLCAECNDAIDADSVCDSTIGNGIFKDKYEIRNHTEIFNY